MSPTLSRQARGVVDTSASPYARLKPVPIGAVRLRSGFWLPRLQANAQAAIPKLYELLEAHGVVDNFRRIYGASQAPRSGPLFTDSDLYKWLEAAAFALHAPDASALRTLIEDTVAAIAPAQRADGYLNTYYVDERYDQRYTRFESDHELYCAGHLIQAAIAYQRVVGPNQLMEVAQRFADHLCQVLPTLPGAFAGHPEIEMALVELYRETGQERYLHLARRLLDATHLADLQAIEGHAVRALYFACGGTDYVAETGDAAYRASLQRQWEDLVQTKLYLTGGVGGRREGESVGKAYELPNARAYAETCAAIANVFWNWRLLGLEGEGRYGDLLERTLYNGFLAGVSLEGASQTAGTHYFYVNPMSYDGRPEGDPWYAWARQGLYERQPWYGCTCCPPNVQRLLASLPGYMYSTSEDGLWVHLYDNADLDWQLSDGTPLHVTQDTHYPWDGEIALGVNPAQAAEFTLHLRVPAWAAGASAGINGRPVPETLQPGSYLALRRLWRPGDRVQLSLPMPPMVLRSHPRYAENRGNLALQRGPLVYCVEANDNPGLDLLAAGLDPRASIAAVHRPELLGGVTVLTLPGLVALEPPDALYRPWQAGPGPSAPAQLTAIPYYAWNNRGPGAMTVWLAEMHA